VRAGRGSDRDPDQHLRAIGDAVVGWFRRGHRDLPWRRTRDPYAVWISEVMLQQTRVETVAPRFERWLQRFPTVRALAEAPLDDVLAEWAGLGYYARARNLHAAAKLVDERHGGALPDDPEAIGALPGIGRYTAGAILSIAFDRPVPILDGNVGRVLARCFRVAGDPKSSATRADLWSLAEQLVVTNTKLNDRSANSSPSALNQGLMELGATICTPRKPACLVCPIERSCEARAAGDPEAYPEPSRPTRVSAVEQVCVALVRRRKVLLARRPPYGLWGGLFELPACEPLPGEPLEETARRAARDRVGLAIDGAPVTPLPPPHDRFEQALSHRRVTFRALRAEAPPGRVRLDGYDAHRWVALGPGCADGLGVARSTKRLLLALADEEGTQP